METKRFIGNDLARLYERVRREFGPDAVIVRTRSLLREGAEPLIELIAAPPQGAEELALDLQWQMVDGALGRLQIARPRVTVGDLEDMVVREDRALPPGPPEPVLVHEPDVPAAYQASEAVFEPRPPEPVRAPGWRPGHPLPDLDEIEPAQAPPIEWVVRQRPEAPRTAARRERAGRKAAPATALEGQLIASGLSEIAARRVAAAGGNDAREALGAYLEALPVRYPDEETTSVITLQGPPGAGRTTALLRMALDCADTGRESVLVAADSSRAAARELIHAYGEATGLPVLDAMEPDALRAAATRARRGACLFVDVPAGAFAAAMPAGVAHHGYLVLPAHWQRGALGRALEGFEARLSGCVLTFTDLSTDLSPAVSVTIEAGAGVAFLSSGRDIAAGIAVADPFALASGILPTSTGERTDGRLAASA